MDIRRMFTYDHNSVSKNNIIYYTSSDDKIVSPYNKTVFGANYESNKYQNGQGVITFDGDITSIGPSAFANCDKLTSIIIPDSVIEIGTNAFAYCKKLTSVTISENILTIGKSAFNNFTGELIINNKIIEADFNSSDCPSKTWLYQAFPNKITIGDNITKIGNYALYGANCTYLTISNSVVTIGNYSFRLTDITNLYIPNSVTKIGYNAFDNCSLLENISIPDSVSSIGSNAFQYCTSLTKVVLPGSIKSIPSKLFYNCENLKTVIINDGVTKIGSNAFDTCSSLSSITIPDSVTEIGNEVFLRCYKLTEITIPKNVIKIGYQVFMFDNLLTTIISKNTIAPQLRNDTFKDIPNNGILYYPEGADYSQWLSTSSYYLGYYGWTRAIISSQITFTINSVQYQAEEGMTWEQWVNSEYNSNYQIYNNKICLIGYIYPVTLNDVNVKPSDIIITAAYKRYVPIHEGGSDD